MFPIKDSIRIPEPPIVTFFLIIVNSLIFFYQSSLSQDDLNRFISSYGLVPVRDFDPEWSVINKPWPDNFWPLVTSTFLHAGWLHIILNMWTLYIFGSSLEGRIGRLQFLSFYLVCGVAASFTHAFFNQDSNATTLGASGAIAGITAAYAATFPRAKITLLVLLVIIPLFFKIPAIAFALIWFALQFFQGFMDLFSTSTGGGIAWWAHIGGFVAGFILIPLWRFKRDLTIDEEARPRKPVLPEPGGSVPSAGTPWRRGPWD